MSKGPDEGSDTVTCNAIQLSSLSQAYEWAWLEIDSRYESNAAKREARLELATVIIDLANRGLFDSYLLKLAAISMMDRAA